MTPNPGTPSNPPAWDKPWIISSVAVFCTLTLIVTYYKLLQWLCQRLCSASLSRNPNQRRRILNQVDQDDLSLQFQRHGLNFYVIRSLPVTQFKKKDEAEAAADNPSSNTDCAICLGEFEDGDWLKHLPKCGHAFHISCIDTWFESHSNCPLCRSQVYGFMHEFPVPMEPTLETLSEDVIQERAAHYQMLRIAILESSQLGREARFAQ